MRSTTRVVTALAVALIAILFVPMVMSIRSTESLSREKDLVAHSYTVLLTVRQLHLNMTQAETARRGFLVDTSDFYRDLFRTNFEAAKSDLDELRNLVADNPSQVRRVDEIAKLFNIRFAEGPDELNDIVVGPDSAKEFLQRPALRATVQQMLSAIDGFVKDELELLEIRRNAVADSVSNTTTLSIILFATALGGVVCLTGFLIISNRRLRHARTALALQAGILQSTLENCGQGIAAFGSTGNINAHNKKFLDFLGLKDALHLKDVVASDSIAKSEEAKKLFAITSSGGKNNGEHHLVAKIGNRSFELYRNAMPEGGFLVVSEDITIRQQAENVLRQSQKMEAIGHLTGGIAHDFNNLLQVVSTNLSLIERSVQSDPRAQQRLSNAILGVKRGATLTSQLLAFARRQPLDPHPINLSRMLTDTVDIMRRTLGETIEIETVIGGGLWNTLADQAQFENAILNLALNARDAMPNGGKLTIELANASLDQNYANAHIDVKPGQYVMLAVTDTGTGMSPQVAERIYEPFFTTKSEGQGTGLGLAQVYGFVKQSGGHIKVYTEVGEGTTFKIYMPRTTLPDEFTGSVTLSPAVGGSEVILVVEDDTTVRTAAVDLLGELGYRVLQAATTEAAAAIIQSGVRIDLLFTDVVMPGPLSTRELARRAQELYPKLRVLFTSGYTANSIVHDGRLDPGVELLSKPYMRDELARKIRSVLSQ
jgi:signal transduction histidine kinase/CHASE3 domain sensor protein